MSMRRVIRGLLAASVLPAAVLGPVFGCRWHIDSQGREDLAAAEGRVDACDPRWRWADVDADRDAVPPAHDAAPVVVRLREAVGPGRNYYLRRPDENSVVLGDGEPNRLLDAQAYALIESALEGTGEARRLAERLRHCPAGRRTLVLTPDYVRSTWDLQFDTYPVRAYLGCEFEQACQRWAADRPVRLTLAMLALGRAYGDEPSAYSQQRRMSEARSAARWLERALALAGPDGSLAEAQAEFDREARTDAFRLALRGERATLDLAFRAADAGRAPIPDLVPSDGWCHTRGRALEEAARAWMYRPHLPADHALTLDTLTRQLAVADLPEPQQRAALMGVPVPPNEPAHLLGHGYCKRTARLLDDVLATRAALRSAVVGLAVERFRLRTGTWPANLDALPRDLLPEVPVDPFTGNTLILVRRPDGLTVYSVGFDGTDDGGTIGRQLRPSEAGTDIGFRLYDPAHRRLAPPPATAGEAPRRFPPWEYGPEPRMIPARE